MEKSRLNVVQVNQMAQQSEKKSSYAGGKKRRLEVQAYFDRLWLVDSHQFDPLRNCMERERLDRTMELITREGDLKGKKIVDLGCGAGVLSKRLRDAGAFVDAVDISENALKKLNVGDISQIHPIQDYVPVTTLKDDAYDFVVCTELIGYLQPDEYRLFFSELARLVKPNGYVVCSTSIDINSEDALQKFADFAETDIEISQWVLSYHRCYIRLKDLFEIPSKYSRAHRDPEFQMKEMKNRSAFGKWWFKINSAIPLVFVWRGLSFVFSPLVSMLKNNRSFLLFLERICHSIWHESGVSQAIFIGKRRKIFQPLPKDQIPRETKHKKQVWE